MADRGVDPTVPAVYQEFLDAWEKKPAHQDPLRSYETGRYSFVPGLLPEQSVRLSAQETLQLLQGRFGEGLDLCLSPLYTDPDRNPGELSPALTSPAAGQPDSRWLKRANVVGVNVRTVGSFWNLVKYSLTLPAAQNAIHLLPIWEPGVLGSLYGISSWELNEEFFSPELEAVYPHLNTTSRQLRAVVNLLHLMGKAVGMDVIPHTDRFSEIVLAFPEYFEWIQRQDTAIIDHTADLHLKVQEKIVQFLCCHGPAVQDETVSIQPEDTFREGVEENQRLRMLFGLPEDAPGRGARRNQLIQYLYRYGFEAAPATMSPPYRGLAVDLNPAAKTIDAHGQVWRDYLITQPTPMSRVFGPLARYKLYEPLDDNAHWELDFSRPRQAVWQYVCEKYSLMQRRYGFDFMRGDMSHVQMRPEGVPVEIDRYYDILGAVKQTIQKDQGVSYFGYLAESFLAPRDVMSYGEEIDHLEASEADATLGDLQSTVLGSPEFLQRFRYYTGLADARLCTPCFTVMTADKDDPRFDLFYQKGNEARLFMALLLPDVPSYMGLGYETRDAHYEPAPNEHYTKLYVIKAADGPKATHGPYVWGKNGRLFSFMTAFKLFLDSVWGEVQGRTVRWLIPPDATGASGVIAWALEGEPDTFVVVVNTNPDQDAVRFGLPHLRDDVTQEKDSLFCEFSTSPGAAEGCASLKFNGKQYQVSRLLPGEGRLYRVKRAL